MNSGKELTRVRSIIVSELQEMNMSQKGPKSIWRALGLEMIFGPKCYRSSVYIFFYFILHKRYRMSMFT
jgi:hypothetical protein